MKSRDPIICYRCDNDCEENGCPGHNLQLEHDATANVVSLIVDGENVRTFDYAQLDALIIALRAEK